MLEQGKPSSVETNFTVEMEHSFFTFSGDDVKCHFLRNICSYLCDATRGGRSRE